jgi:hypothetical protein
VLEYDAPRRKSAPGVFYRLAAVSITRARGA